VLRRHAFSTEFLFIFTGIFLQKRLENSLPKMPVGTPRFFAPFFGEKRSKISPVRSRVRSGLFFGENFGKILAAFRRQFLALSVCQWCQWCQCCQDRIADNRDLTLPISFPSDRDYQSFHIHIFYVASRNLAHSHPR